MATKTIGSSGADYTTIQAWEDDLPATLTEPEVGQLQDQDFPAGCTFSGTTTSAVNTITLTTATGAGFRDHASAAANALRPNPSNGACVTFTGTYASAFTIGVSHVIFRGLQVRATGAAGFAISQSAGGNVTLDSCLIEARLAGNVVGLGGANNLVKNCLIWCAGSSGTGIHVNGEIYDTTVVRPANFAASGTGVRVYYTSALVKNVAVFGFATPFGGGGSFNSDSDHNATDRATIGIGQGTHNLAGLTYADQFANNGASGSYLTVSDYRLKAGSSLIEAGIAVAGVAVDVINTSRPQGSAHDIGAWEIPVAFGPTTATTSGPSSGRVATDSTAFTVTLNVASVGTKTVNLASSGPGDVFRRTQGGGSFTSITISDGATTGTFYLVPDAATGPRTITPTTAGITFTPKTLSYIATAGLAAGAASFVSSGSGGIAVSSTEAAGGNGPYTKQWQRNRNGGSYSNLSNGLGVSGATTLALTDGSAVPGILYGYKVVYTDAAAASIASNAVTAQVYSGGTLTGGSGAYSRGVSVNNA